MGRAEALHYELIAEVAPPPPVYRMFTFVPSYEPTGLFGAKNVGEICINGPLPAISNAIYDVVDIRLHRTPFTPDKVLEALQARERG